MAWFVKDDATKPNVKKANNAWLSTRKKLFPDGLPAPPAPSGGAAKGKAPATPRKKQDQETSKTPHTKKTPAKQGKGKAEDDQEGANEAATGPNSVTEAAAANGGARNTDIETEETGEADVKEADQLAANQKVADVDGDTPVKDSTAEKPGKDNPTTPATGTSIADDMSAGSMSPTPASTTTKAGPITPKPKAASKNNKTTVNGSAASVPLPSTPATPTPKATPKKRKTKAEKDAEAAQAITSDGAEDDADGKPPAKKRKSVDGKAVVKNEGDEDVADVDSDASESTKPTPVKTPRKPSAAQLAKREEKEKEKAAKKAEKEQDKAAKKAEKEREKEREKAEKKAEKEREKEREKAEKKAEKERVKAAKQAEKKAAKGAATDSDGKGESSEPRTPRKLTTANPAKKAEKEEAEKAEKEVEDKTAANAKTARAALAQQEEINKQANDVFSGARIDKPASSSADEDDADEDTIAVNDDAPKTNGFIAINRTGNGDGSRAASVTAAETVKVATAEEYVETDGDTIAVTSGEKMTSVEVGRDGDTIAVGQEG
jgi:hypothetical protein